MSRQKIFFEGLALVDGHFSGVGHYIAGILKGIDDLAGQAKLERKPFPDVYVIIPWDNIPQFNKFGFKHVKYKRFPLKSWMMRGLHHRDILPPIDLICGKGLYVFTRFARMPLVMSKSMVIIYDISFELHKEFGEERNLDFLHRVVSKSVKKSDKIITISENARQEIVDFYKTPAKKVVVATPSVDRKTFYRRSQKNIDAVKKRYGVHGKYLLYVGNLEPRKNLSGLVDAYVKLPKAMTDEYSLLLVGVSGWKTEALSDKIIGYYGQGYNITRPSSYVIDEDLPALFSGARAFVYPSHYEGFGMPPLEALACGTPAITANNSSLPESVGDAGILVDTNPETIAKAIQACVSDPMSLEKARTKGPEQAAKFSWNKSAQVVIDEAMELL